MAFILIFAFLNTLEAAAEQRGTFSELVLEYVDASFASVHIRDTYRLDSPFGEGLMITRRTEVRRMLNALGEVQLIRSPYDYATNYEWPPEASVRLFFSERGAPGTQVTSPWGVHFGALSVIIFPERGLLNIEGSYFYFDTIDLDVLLNVSPLSLLNPGTAPSFWIFFIALIVIVGYWFRSPQAEVQAGAPVEIRSRKELNARNYLIAIWLILFFLVLLMLNEHPYFFTWVLRGVYAAFCLTILAHSKKHGLHKTMLWELAGILLSLLCAFIFLFSPAEAVASVLRLLIGHTIALIAIGAPVYMLFLVIIMRHTPTHQRIRTKVTIVATAVATILFFLLMFYPEVFRFR